jgi:uncharacterized protein YcfJ
MVWKYLEVLMTQSRILTIAGVGLLAVVAVLGWTRKTEVASQPLLAPGAYPATSYGAPATSLPTYATRPAVRTIQARPVAQTYADRTSYTTRRTVVRERPKKHSVAIVAGSAGVGAAIGALAGGGKGAAIGALAGGGGGFIYDRLTHKKRVEVQ